MTAVLSTTRDTPTPEAAPDTVFRTELNPVDFLHRAAYMYPDKVAVATRWSPGR
jgi:hypothetical protein